MKRRRQRRVQALRVRASAAGPRKLGTSRLAGHGGFGGTSGHGPAQDKPAACLEQGFAAEGGPVFILRLTRSIVLGTIPLT
jgi:hypothetical protein